MIPALALFLLQSPAALPAGHGPEPGPLVAVAGMPGFQGTSRLEASDGATRLTAVYLFPDRVRWHLESSGTADRPPHLYRYRRGELVHEGEGGSSRALEGEERDSVLLEMELRRAVFSWPAGFDWSGEEGERRSAPVFADSCCKEGPIGTLVATLEAGRPVRFHARDAQEKDVGSIEVRAWKQQAGRSWPVKLAVQSRIGAWVETTESIGTRVHYVELSFLPPDRRPPSGISSAGQPLVARDLVAMTYASRPLPAACTWEQARAQAREWIAETQRGLEARDLAVDPVPTFSLGSDGLPRSCWIRLITPLEPPPPGFETLGERIGFLLALRGLAEVEEPFLERLSKAAPPGTRPGNAYLRIHDRPQFPIELVIPLEPGE